MPTTRDLAFISYSHQDPEWLRRLQILLKPYVRKGQLRVWADPYIEVGSLWRRDIDAALAQTRVGILLVSQNFAASDFIYDVELPALRAAADEGVLTLFCVPISSVDPSVLDLDKYQWARPPGEPLDLLDEPRRNQALTQLALQLVRIFEPVTEATEAVQMQVRPRPLMLARAIAPLSHAGGSEGALHGVPSLPDNFILRDAELIRLKRSLFEELNARHGISSTGSARGHGLHGQGGIGKTVIATALAHDPEVRRAFPDGIYWVTLGQEPNLLALQQSLLTLAGASRAVESVNVGAAALRDALADKRCLLVLDDVWSSPHLSAFDALGPQARLLITTRDREILSGLGAGILDLGVLPPDSAKALLAKWASVTPEALPADVSEVAKECGYLPLALAVAGALVKDGTSWSDVLEALRQGDLEFLDHAHQSVFKSLSASVRALFDAERQRYLELAIFPEDTAVPEGVIVRLWEQGGLKGYQARQLLRRLANKALLTLSSEDGEAVVTFHDLQGDYLRFVVEDPRPIHERLLSAYRVRLPAAERESRRWAELPVSETYLWTHLIHHMLGAEHAALLEELVTDARWLVAKVGASGVSALLTDLAQSAERTSGADVRRVQRALWQEAGWLHQDPGALPGLLHNRLRGHGLDEAELEHLLGDLRPKMRLVHPVRFGEERVFRGHAEPAAACAYSPDGSRILSASQDQTLREWDRATGRQLTRFDGHSGRVTACAYSPDGSRVLSASQDQTLREWDRATGKELTRFDGHSRWVVACAYSPDGSRILSASHDSTLREWDRATGKQLTRFDGHSDSAVDCAYSPDGSRILSASHDNTVREWDRATGKELTRFDGHSGWVVACAYSPDGSRILSASHDKTLREWDRVTGKQLIRFDGHSGWVVACAYSPDGSRILSASHDKTLREWDRATGKQLTRLDGHASYASACAYSPDGSYILSASGDNTLREWDLAVGERLARFDNHAGPVNACAYSPGGTHVLSASDDRTLREWDRASGKPLTRFEGHTGPVSACAYSPDGSRILSGSPDRTLREWDRSAGHSVACFEGGSGAVLGCRYSPDGSCILSAADFGELREWARSAGVRPVRFEGHSTIVLACAYSPDGSRVLSASFDRTLREWNRATGDELTRFEGHANAVGACAYSPDGSRVLSASLDSTVKIWCRATGKCLDTLYGTAPMRCLAVTRGQFVAGDDLGNLWIVDCDWLD